MRTALRILAVVVVLVAAGAGYLFWRTAPRIPDRPFVRPSGPYAVGTSEFFWTDSSRAEPYTKDPTDHRRVVVQVWYPAAQGGLDTAFYLPDRKAFASRFGGWLARKARTNAVVDAPLAASDSSGFPILLYNHGGLWTRWSATFSTEWLASQGYVVFSAEHFGFSQTVRFPDGTPFAADTLFFPTETGDGKRDALASWAFLDDPVFTIWLGDAQFVLDRVARLAQDPGPFQGRLDLLRIGAFGWSFGGALAVELAAADPRIIAAVDHDGQLFGDVKQRGTGRPVLQIHHGADDALDYPEEQRPVVRELIALTESWDSTARARSTADWYSVTIAGTTHGDFSDLSLFYRRGKDHLDPRRAHQIINAYTLAFFDEYVRGTPADLLDQAPAPFGEVTFASWLKSPPVAEHQP